MRLNVTSSHLLLPIRTVNPDASGRCARTTMKPGNRVASWARLLADAARKAKAAALLATRMASDM